jgi:Ca2+-transporting ATPase
MRDGVVTARDTTMTFTVFVLYSMFNAQSCRSELKSIRQIGVFTNKPLLISIILSLIGQLMVIYLPFFQRVFQTEALSFGDLLLLLFAASTVLAADEVRKFMLRRKVKIRGKKEDDTMALRELLVH